MHFAVMHQLESDIDSALAVGELIRAEKLAERYCGLAECESSDGNPSRDAWLRAHYLAAQVALAAGQLSRALEHLAPLLPAAARTRDEKLAGWIRTLTAEALVRLRRHAEARDLLQQVSLALLQESPLLRFRALRVRLWLGELADLGDELAACAGALRSANDSANVALLACDEGRAWDRAGNLALAQECWERAERLSRRLERDPIRADVLLQLGRLDHLRGHLASALDRYDEAARHAGQSPLTQEIEWRRLLIRLDFGEWDTVRIAASRLRAIIPLETLAEEVRPVAELVCVLLDDTTLPEVTDEVLAYLAARRGDVNAARSLYAAALAATPSPERRARSALALGLLALICRDEYGAWSWLRQAEDLARSQNLPEVLARALQMAGQMAAEQQGNDEFARKLFEEAVLIAEVQEGQLRNASDRAFHRWRRSSVLRQLLRSACRRGDAERAFFYQERERGRLLLDLLHSAGACPIPLVSAHLEAEVAELQRQLASCEKELNAPEAADADPQSRREMLHRREELLIRRDRLFEESLRNRGPASNAILPSLPTLDDLRSALPAGVLYLAPTLSGDDFFLIAVSREREPEVVRATGSGLALRKQLDQLRGCLEGQIARYRAGLLGAHDRSELDTLLEEIGRGPLGEALSRAFAFSSRLRRIIWVPDYPLHGLPIHAVRLGGRYLVEDVEFVWNFSGALVVHQARTYPRRGLIRPAVVIAEAPTILPEAEHEGRGVAASFLWSRQVPAASANRATIRLLLARACVAHFACHAEVDGLHPLASFVRLPSREVIHALDWLYEPLAGLPLVTLSACRSAEVAPLLGNEVFGLVTGLLGGGVRAVLASMWPVPDRETPELMWGFYRHRLESDLATALARTQRAALTHPNSSPLFWAAFALYGDASALPAPGRFGRWLGRLRARRHAARFPQR
jgi:tetratricopeptide (TPR) repeat protein